MAGGLAGWWAATNKLFGDVPQQGMYQGSRSAMQASGQPYMTQQWANAPIGWSQQQAAPSQRPGGLEPLTQPLPDDSFLKRTFGAALLGAKEIVGLERYADFFATAETQRRACLG